MESTNYYILRSILGYSKTVSYDTLLRLADIKSLATQRISIISSAVQVLVQPGSTIYQ